MSKKLLSEAQVRRFQSLASIEPINEMAYGEEEKVEETYNEEIVNEEEEAMAPESPEAMETADEDESDAEVELDEELVEKFMNAVSTIQEVADALGGEVAEMGDEASMDLDADKAEEAPVEIEMDAGGEEEKEEEDMLQESLSGIDYVPSQKEIVKIVAQRVAKRLSEAKEAQAKLNKALGKK